MAAAARRRELQARKARVAQLFVGSRREEEAKGAEGGGSDGAEVHGLCLSVWTEAGLARCQTRLRCRVHEHRRRRVHARTNASGIFERRTHEHTSHPF
eukprot:5126099-Pleurochrysis_carterae.AAC.1